MTSFRTLATLLLFVAAAVPGAAFAPRSRLQCIKTVPRIIPKAGGDDDWRDGSASGRRLSSERLKKISEAQVNNNSFESQTCPIYVDCVCARRPYADNKRNLCNVLGKREAQEAGGTDKSSLLAVTGVLAGALVVGVFLAISNGTCICMFLELARR